MAADVTRAAEEQPKSRTEQAWGLYQWGRLWSVHFTRRDAIQAACDSSGHPWRKTRKYFAAQKVKVTPL